ncbi:MAG: AtpZ/AtpI family protein [Candidatus Pacebacteria bacterium]|jgi:ATP synthase protein I|nr:AtpZ/AtpI family protein [Candidatus Paceibacterota bacterium]
MVGSSDNFKSGIRFAVRISTGLIVAIFLGTFTGYLLDKYFHTKPWLILLGLFIGFTAGLLNVYRYFKEEEKK